MSQLSTAQKISLKKKRNKKVESKEPPKVESKETILEGIKNEINNEYKLKYEKYIELNKNVTNYALNLTFWRKEFTIPYSNDSESIIKSYLVSNAINNLINIIEQKLSKEEVEKILSLSDKLIVEEKFNLESIKEDIEDRQKEAEAYYKQILEESKSETIDLKNFHPKLWLENQIKMRICWKEISKNFKQEDLRDSFGAYSKYMFDLFPPNYNRVVKFVIGGL